MDFGNKVVLIVGASSGKGRRLAQRLAAEGAFVVTARRKDLLDALVDEMAHRGDLGLALAADAQDPYAAEQVVNEDVRCFGRIDLVLLNASGAPALDMRTMGAREVLACMRANYDVAVNVLFPVLHQMVRQGGGLVAQTNSLAGWLGVPLQGPYSAAKGALRLLIDTCRIEFGPLGVRFVSIYPGFVATEATANDGMPAPLALSEAQAVEHMVRALRREPLDHLFPFSMCWLVRLALLLPKRWTTRILRNELPALPVHPTGAPPTP
jgi:NAD(P)-dependent dehydrogenase (short-subunit alcohol dehydrogenase family)